MRTELAVESLLDLIQQSGVIPQDQMLPLLQEFRERRGQFDSSTKIADELVAREALTRWQADQLLHGKHQGFFLGPYRILSLLGQGGMGRVYLAEHQMMRRRCAIKVLPSKYREDKSSTVDRFYREAQAVAALDHPNIVRAYDVNKTLINKTEFHYLVMEYVGGQDLQRMVEEQGVLEYREAADFIRQAAEGLAHAHQRGLVHRDVKPSNLLVDSNGVVKLLDLGLAKFFVDDAEASREAEHQDSILGTVDYLAPEQARNSYDVDARADIYGLGQTCYFLLTGHPPFPRGTVAERLRAHQTKSPEPIETSRPDAPPELVAMIDKMTAKLPARRYQSAEEVAEAMDQWLRDYADDSRLTRITSLLRKGHRRPPSSPGEPAPVGSTRSKETELELAPLDEDEAAPPSTGTAPTVAKEEGVQAPSADHAPAPSDDHASPTLQDGSPPGDSTAEEEHAVPDDLPDLAPLEKDLVAVLEENDLASGVPKDDSGSTPPGSQAALSSPRRRRAGQESIAARLLASPALWIGIGALIVIVLITALWLGRPSAEQVPRRPVRDEPQQTTRPIPQVPPPPPPGEMRPSREPPQNGRPPQDRDRDQGSGVVRVVPPPPIRVVAGPQVIVPVGSTWRWLHPINGVDPAAEDEDFHTTFFATDYDDSHWQTGPDIPGWAGGFGYGDDVGVAIGEPAREHRKTAYFRHTFETDTAVERLYIMLQRDDGVIVYLDGKEVGRDNVGAGREAYDLFADMTIGGDDETRVNRFGLTGSLEPGRHVLAISLHNRPGGSSDLRIAEISLHGVRSPAKRSTANEP